MALGLLLLAVSLGISGGVGIAGASPARAAVGCPAPYAFSETPTNGTAPLLVRFSLAGPVGSTTPVSWSFGDGAWFNGTGNDYTFTVHSYLVAGNYTATVTVDPSSPEAVCSGTVLVRAAAIQVVVNPPTVSGVAPFTVDFTATVSGGTGAYRSETWSFGDGAEATGVSVNYTFVTPGSYSVLLVVADSAGSQGIGVSQVLVGSSTVGNPPGSSRSTGDSLLGWGLLVLGAVLFAVAILFVARTFRNRAPLSPAGVPPVGGAPPGPPAPAGALTVRAPGPPTLPRDPTVLRSSQRVIAHLARQGPPPAAPVGLRTTTQAGIGEALGLEQSNLARILRRLELAGLIVSELRHVPGSARRVRAYSLTRPGESLSRALLRDLPSPRDVPGSENRTGRE